MDTVDNALCSTLLSISIVTSLLSPVISIDRYSQIQLSLTTFVDRFTHTRLTYNGYRWIGCSVYCGRQWPSMDAVNDLFSSTMSIDRQHHPSIVANEIYRWILFTIYCRRQYLSIDCPPRPLYNQ